MIKTIDDIQKELLLISKEQEKVAQAEQQLTQVMSVLKEFKNFKKLSQSYDKRVKELKESATRVMKKNNVKTLENDIVKITLVQRHSYKVSDASKLKGKYKVLAKEDEIKKTLKEVKNEFEVLHKNVPGIEQSITEYSTLTFKESSED